MKTKTQFSNRILSLVLAFVMALGMLPMTSFTALAADGDSCAVADCTGTYKGGICTYTPTHYEQPTETTDKYDLDGDDIKDTVYEIANEGQLRWFAAKVNDGSASLNAVLTTDITFTSEWTPIGNFDYRYSGFFDGQNYTVDFAFHSAEYRDYSGLFGYSTGIVKNVKVYNFIGNFTNYDYAAAVVGYNKGTISNCVNLGVTNGTMFSVGSYGGGIAGQNDGGIIENCTSYVPVYGNANSGGIAGGNDFGTIKNCINYGKITAYTQNHGGIVGINYQGTVENCVNYGAFSYGGTPSYVGGIAGSNRGTMKNCANYAYVCGATLLGGIAGYNDGQITYCQNDGNVNATSADDYHGGIVGRNAGTISACINSGEISGFSTGGYVGGIAGYNGSSKIIENCANTGYINILKAGAIAGNNGGSINACYNYGELKAGAYGVVYWNSGSLSNVYYKNGNIFYFSTTDATATKMTAEQFASGEVAYLLNNKVSDGTQVWYQNVDNGQTVDAYPVLDSASGTIYRKCNGTSYVYSNSNEGIVHNFTGECDTICDICEYSREVSVGHIEGTPANCNRGAICQTCGSEYGEKSGEHDVNEETAVCRECNHQFALKYETVNSEKPMFTDDANTAIDACFGRKDKGAEDGTVTLFTDVIYSGNIKNQVQTCISTIVLNGHTLTLSGRGFDFWGTQITIDGTNGGSLNCMNGSPIIWNSNATVKIIGNPSYKQNGNAVALKFTGFSSSTPTLDLTEYTGNGFTFTQSYSASITVNLPDKYMLVNANTGEIITSADVVKGVTAKVVYNHIHEWEYTVSGTTITATCENTDGYCSATDGGYVTISAPNSLTYTGSKIEAVVDNKLTTDAAVAVEYTKDPIDVGSYTASITLDGKTISVTYAITAASISDANIVVGGTYTYDGTSKKPTDITVTLNGKTLIEDLDYTVSYNNNTNAGQATVIVTGKGNYTGSINGSFEIGRAELTDVSVQQNGKLTYDGGKALTPAVTANATALNGAKVLFMYSADGTSYGSMPTFTEVGTYTVYYCAYTADNNFIDYYDTFTVTVEKAIVTVPAIASNVYNGSAQSAQISETDFYTVTQSGGTNVGKYDVVLTLKDSANYQWESTEAAAITLTFEITKAAATVAEAPTAKALIYTGVAQKLVTDGTSNDGKLVYSLTENGQYTETIPTGTTAGEYTVWYYVQGGANHADTAKTSVTVTIAKADYDMSGVKWVYDHAFLYDGEQHSVAIDESTLPQGVTVSNYTGHSALEVGKYNAAVSLAYDYDNYNYPSVPELIWEIRKDYSSTENTDKVADITAETVTPEDKTNLENAKADLEKALEENGECYTEDQKKAIQEEIDRIEAAIEVIEKVEGVTETITQLPESVEPDDEDAAQKILAAKEAYDELTDHEKSVVDDEAKKKLDDLVAALTAYKIIKGDGSTWSKGGRAGLSFTVNGAYSKFVGIKVNGADVDQANYDAKSGSTIITLKVSYLQTLEVGTYTITVVYTDGSTDGTFKVAAKPATPPTGDDFNIVLYGSAMVVSATALCVLLLTSKKRKYAK